MFQFEWLTVRWWRSMTLECRYSSSCADAPARLHAFDLIELEIEAHKDALADG
jgi:hypothetical protein